MKRIRLGEMLLQEGLIEQAQLDEALQLQREYRDLRLGEALVELGFVDELQLAQVLSNQLSIPWVDLFHVNFSRELLSLIPAVLADQHSVVPIYIQNLSRAGKTLFVATDDPTNEPALEAVSRHCGLPVKAMVAPASDVRNAIRVYYGVSTDAPRIVSKRHRTQEQQLPAWSDDSGEYASPDPAAPPTEPSDTLAMDTRPTPADGASIRRRAELASSNNQLESSSELESSTEFERRVPDSSEVDVSSRPEMVQITLIDGTTVRLPRTRREAPDSVEHGLTARDLIAALQARAEGRDVDEILPDTRWEPLMAALLSLLLRKGVIGDWEFVEEWMKHRR